MRALIAVVASAGCGFTVAGGSAVIDGSPPDSTSTIVDGMPDAMGTSACPWPFAATYANPCDIDRPLDVAVLDLDDTSGPYRYDTATAVLTTPTGVQQMVPATMIAGVRVVWTAGVRIRDGVRLRVTGPMSLAIVSNDDILVDGLIDVSSAYDRNTHTVDGGAGANPTSCGPVAPLMGGACADHGGSGGGGGAFGGDGGSGGSGGGTRDCGNNTMGRPGGIGGTALATAPLVLRGGCSGASGAGSSVNPAGLPGVAGEGGGAVALIARDAIAIKGRIHAGGSGGGPGRARRAGGGGGGSGGMIALEAVTILVDEDAVIAANGGGGGGGCDGSDATAGDDGGIEDQPADGGPKQGNGGNGAAGGALDPEDGANAAGADRGGGGGGGGAGFVRLNATTKTLDGTISPAPR